MKKATFRISPPNTDAAYPTRALNNQVIKLTAQIIAGTSFLLNRRPHSGAISLRENAPTKAGEKSVNRVKIITLASNCPWRPNNAQ
ncbi:MAG TPA: hypothetical protein VLM42_13190 [Bryobacteraceae bacterium]|nr:hypothetical protein [Bryobacteraceae bacterium]